MSAWGLALLLGGALAGVGWLLHRTRRERAHMRQRLDLATQELERLQRAFARFAPEQVIERIIAGGIATSAEKKDVTVLFADLVGFTALGEQLEPEVLVRVLNGYFARMSRVVAAHRGHVSKFIGDGMLALFGAIERNPWQANDAVHAALAMRAELAAYGRELGRQLPVPLRVGIGVHRGPVVAGITGSDQLMEFTVIGPTVNLASRVERLTRTVDADILVTDAVREALDPRFALRPLAPVPVRGIAEPVATWAVQGFRE